MVSSPCQAYDSTLLILLSRIALHELDPVFRKVTLENEKIRAVARDLAYHKDPVVLQSMVIFKQPQIGGKVPEHNDSTFLYTDPPSAVGFWFALEDCTPSNGALSFFPGSHKTSPISSRFIRMPGGTTGFEDMSLTDGGKKRVGTSKDEDYIQPECPAGE